MISFDLRKSTAAFGAAALILVGSGCATKKHVRQVVGPVEARVSGAERTNREQQAALGELNNSVARADEKAQDAEQKAVSAGQRADQAGQRADQANQAAQTARARADEGYSLAEQTRSRLGELSENIDNYRQVTTAKVNFAVGKYQLTKAMMEDLDNAVAQLQGTKNYILEVQGYTDSTGTAAANLELSRKRADAVVRYLTTKHNVPLRRISMLGLGEDDPNADNKTRAGRKEARRVEIRVFSRDLGGQNASNTGMNSGATTSSDASMPRLTQQGAGSGTTGTYQQGGSQAGVGTRSRTETGVTDSTNGNRSTVGSTGAGNGNTTTPNQP